MNHDDDVRAGAQRLAIAGLLVRAVPVVPIVNEQLQAEFARDRDRLVLAAIVDEEDHIHHVVR